jgi:aminoglycoside phosphotransferase (APT) family kinase protein
MHDGEVAIGIDLVKRLVSAQFPCFRGQSIRPVKSTGTVNAIYRIGDRFCARLPRLPAGAKRLERELRWLPKIAGALPLSVPELVAPGAPTREYPFPWAILRWIPGRTYRDDLVRDELQAAMDLAAFIRQLRGMDVAGVPRAGRRHLAELDAVTRRAVQAASGLIDADAASAAWEHALQAPPWGGTPVWRRARGYALHQALLIIPYYVRSNPAFSALARRTVNEVIKDVG